MANACKRCRFYRCLVLFNTVTNVVCTDDQQALRSREGCPQGCRIGKIGVAYNYPTGLEIVELVRIAGGSNDLVRWNEHKKVLENKATKLAACPGKSVHGENPF